MTFLFDEAVDKGAKDHRQNHTAAEDHHLFLKGDRHRKRREEKVTHQSLISDQIPFLETKI